MKSIKVNTVDPYEIIIKNGLIDEIGSYIHRLADINKLMIICDSSLKTLYLDRVKASLFDYSTYSCIIKGREENKNLEAVDKILGCLYENDFTRTDAVIALGGGITGDIAGFAASIYLRGIRFIQIPTTLLAAIDSSVGGKTGVNLKNAKNQVGSFWQPRMVLCDPISLKTLEPNIFNDGMAEAVKYAMISGRSFKSFLRDFDSLTETEELIYRCVDIKSGIVEQDEKDRGQRQLLNFGHTIGHAIEACSGNAISHGRAVAIGMALMTMAAVRNGDTECEAYEELIGLLNKFGLPSSTVIPLETLAGYIKKDKKSKGNKITLVLPENNGCFLREFDVKEAISYIIGGSE